MSWPLRSLVVLALAVLSACEGPARALGSTPVEARRHADEVFSALAQSFGPLQLEAAVAELRLRLARHAFVPSHLFDDAAWARPEPHTRLAVFSGRQAAGRYWVKVGPSAPAPGQVADYRSTLELRWLSADEYEWSQHDELAIGALGVADAERALTALLALLESADDAGAADRLRASLPKSTAVLGRGFRLDRVRLLAASSGGRTLSAQATLQPEALGPGSARLASFLRREVLPMRFHLSVGDAQARFWELDVFEGRIALELHVQSGRLVPLAGPPRPMPWPLRATTAFSTDSGLFRIGFRHLEAEVDLVSSRQQAGFAARFQRTPDWDLPFVVQPFLRGSLRRPFEGQGARLAFGLVAPDEGPSLLTRDYRVAVRESGLMRWLSDFAGGTVMDFRSTAEAEFDRYAGEVLEALHQDLLALASR
jgi:hypothetical protein